MIAKPKRGRPVQADAKRRRRMIGVRLADNVRAAVETEAGKSGRSLSQEIEARVERSLDTPHLLPAVLEAAYGRQLAGLLMVIGRVMADAGQNAGFMSTPTRSRRDDWPEDLFAYDVASKALAHVVDAFRPIGNVETPPAAESFVKATGFDLDTLSRGWASGALSAVAGRFATAQDKIFAHDVRPLLGKLADVES